MKPEPKIFTGDPLDVLNQAAICELIGCQPRDLADLVASGKLKARKSGRSGYRATRRAVLEFLEEEK
jgi:hypothetical protein